MLRPEHDSIQCDVPQTSLLSFTQLAFTFHTKIVQRRYTNLYTCLSTIMKLRNGKLSTGIELLHLATQKM